MLILLALALIMTRQNLTLHVYASNPDSYGNYIFYVSVAQWSDGGANWITLDTVHYYEYNNDTGFEVVVGDNNKTAFFIRVMINDTLAASQAEAIARTRVLLTIDHGVCTAALMNYSESVAGPAGGFYYVDYDYTWDVGGEPTGGIQYEVIFDYEVYR